MPCRPQFDGGRARGPGRQIHPYRFQPALNAGFPMALHLNPDIFKAYDVRGTYPDQIQEDGARAIGAAFAAYLKGKRVAVGRDMRLSSPALAAAFIDGVTSHGTDVVDYG